MSNVRLLRKSYERFQDVMDNIGQYWTPRRRVQFDLVLFFYFLVMLTDEVISKSTNSISPAIYSLVIGIEVTLILKGVFFFGICCFDFYRAEKLFLIHDAASIACLVGYILLKSIYLKADALFIVLSVIVAIFIFTTDYTTQRLKTTGRRQINFSQLYRQHSSKNPSMDASKVSMGSLYSVQHDFQAVSPTINDDSDETTRSVRIDVDEMINSTQLSRPYDQPILLYPSSSSPSSSSSSSSNIIKATPIEIIDTDSIEFEGFRVKLTSLPSGSSPAPENVSWDSFEFIEHRIDSSSCHIYTAIWQDNPVIIKLIKADRINSPMAVSEFEMEANILSRVRHPNIVRLLGSGLSPRRFLILELLDGGSLSHALGIRPDANRRYIKRKFTFKQTLQMARSIASALDYLHNQWNSFVHIIHRDLKPDNIGWTSDGQLKVFDFGLCTCVRSQRDRKEQYRLTGNTGTLRYMAPEVALGRPYNRTVDVYSFGIILWQVLRMQIPFKHMHKKDYMEKVVMGGQRPPLDRRWPKQLRTLLDGCWHEDKLMRPDFGYIVSELDSLIKEVEEKELSLWYRIKYCFHGTMISIFKGVTWSRPLLLLLAVICLTGTLVLLISIPSEHNHSTDSREQGGIVLSIVAYFCIHLIGMTYVRGSSRRPLTSRDLIMGLELNQNPTTRFFNPMAAQNTVQQPLYGL